MPKDIPKRIKQKYYEGETSLDSKMKKLSISSSPQIPIATSEFYYSLNFTEAEKNYQLLAASSPSKKSRMERKIEKLEDVDGKLKNLTISVKNEKPKSPTKKPKKEETNDNLFQQLRQLQQGTMQSSDLPSISRSPKAPKAKVKKSQEDIERNRKEIMELNKQIQSKIANQIKPRLADIINRGAKPKMNGMTESKPHDHRQLPPLQMPATNEIVPIRKTKISEDMEIYRYTFAQLYQLQKFATWEMVPRLLKLGICKTSLSVEDTFLLTLINSNHAEREKIILKAAEKKNFIKRVGDTFSFNLIESLPVKTRTLSKSEPPKEESPPIREDRRRQERPEVLIDRFRLIAKNDQELNELIYQHEFISLFESELKDQDLKDQSHAEILMHLLESNKAYLVEGEIRVNSKNNQEAYVSHRKGMKDICIKKIILRKHAFHGDFVRVLVKQNSGNEEDLNASQSSENIGSEDLEDAIQLDETVPENRNFGCVLDILEKRHSRCVVGTFASFTNMTKNRKYLMVNVRDTKVPNIRVDVRKLPTDVELTDKLLLTVEIIGWSHDQPHGVIKTIIGKKGELKTENAAILQQHNLDPKPYETTILLKLPKEPFTIPAEEFEYRMDLRKKCIFSIDPESARDLDDALSCEVLSNGNLEIGVHISDVSYFVKEDSELDLIVKEKATTIYLVDQVYHMLPEQLCLLCSLLPGADKLAYSVIFEMNLDTAHIYKTRFTRSVVNSCAKLSYDHAQMVIDKKDKNWTELEGEFPEILNGFTVSDVAEVITKLQKLALVMRASRKDKGSLKIDQPKLAFRFEKDDRRMEAPIDFFKYVTKDSNRLIEEFMLLANISVASFIKESFPEVSLLRHHPAPNENGLQKLVNNLNKHGVALDTSSSKALSKSMESIVSFAKQPMAMNAALNLLVSRTMTRANYFCSGLAEKDEDYWHYALSIPIYTHFTSPIRRYADVLVHRVLNAALNYDTEPKRKPEEIQMCATVCNAQKQAAKLAGDESSNLYFTHFIQSMQSKTMRAAVLGIYDYNLEVVLIDTGHLIKVYYKNLQQSDKDLIIKTFVDNSPPYVTIHHYSLESRIKSSMKIEFGSELLVKLEVVKEKLVINKIFFNASN